MGSVTFPIKLRSLVALTPIVVTALGLVTPPAVVAATPLAVPSVDEAYSVAKTRRPRPPQRLPPNRVRPGGGLDDAAQACQPNSAPLTALVPVSNPVYTASAHPTFLFHLSDPPEAIAYGEFILLRADEKEQIYTTRFTPIQSGIIDISVPTEAAYALEVGEAYHWYLNVHCQTAPQATAPATAQSTGNVPSVNGWVQRVTPDGSSALLTEDVLAGDRLTEGTLPELWYDAIAQTAAVLATENTPNSPARTTWQNWLSAIGLGELADVPLTRLPVTPQSL